MRITWAIIWELYVEDKTSWPQYLILHKLHVLIELGLAFVALWQEVEAEAADVLTGIEVGRAVHLGALYLEFHQSPTGQPHIVALAQVAADNLGEGYQHIVDGTRADALLTAQFLDYPTGVNGLGVAGYGLVLAERLERRLSLFLQFVSHNNFL